MCKLITSLKKTENNIDSSTKKIKLLSYITHPPPPPHKNTNINLIP